MDLHLPPKSLVFLPWALGVVFSVGMWWIWSRTRPLGGMSSRSRELGSPPNRGFDIGGIGSQQIHSPTRPCPTASCTKICPKSSASDTPRCLEILDESSCKVARCFTGPRRSLSRQSLFWLKAVRILIVDNNNDNTAILPIIQIT